MHLHVKRLTPVGGRLVVNPPLDLIPRLPYTTLAHFDFVYDTDFSTRAQGSKVLIIWTSFSLWSENLFRKSMLDVAAAVPPFSE